MTADPDDCSFQFNPVGTAKFTNSCDITKALLSRASVNSTTVDAPAGTVAAVKIGDTVIPSYSAPPALLRSPTLTAALETAKAGTDQAAIDAAQAALDAEKGGRLPSPRP